MMEATTREPYILRAQLGDPADPPCYRIETRASGNLIGLVTKIDRGNWVAFYWPLALSTETFIANGRAAAVLKLWDDFKAT